MLQSLNGYIIDSLPAAQSLTGCDTVAKIGTKASRIKILESNEEMLKSFGKDVLDEEMISDAETFLINVVAKNFAPNCSSFNELRLKMFHQFPKKKLTELVCSSDSIQQNIKRGYFQTRTWLDAPFLDSSEFLDPLDYGFDLNLDSMTLVPSFFKGSQKPTDVIEPCFGCETCAKKTCPCRVIKVMCNEYCSCFGTHCKNPFNE